MESNDLILARCAGCDRNFETRHYGQQACPICHAQVYVPPQLRGSSDDSLPPPGEFISEAPAPRISSEAPAPRISSEAPAPRMSDPSAEKNGRIQQSDRKLESDIDRASQEFVPAFESATNGYIKGFIQTIKDIISSPAAFFIRLRVGKAGMGSAIVFGSIIYTIALNFCAFYLLLVFHRTALQGKLGTAAPDLPFIKSALSWTMYLSPLLALLNLLVCAGLYHLLVVLTTPSHRGFGATVRATAYGSVPLLLSAIPYIGWLLGIVWTWALQIIALSQVHRMSPWRALLVVGLASVALFMVTYWIRS
jgi:hypothetical protein